MKTRMFNEALRSEMLERMRESQGEGVGFQAIEMEHEYEYGRGQEHGMTRRTAGSCFRYGSNCVCKDEYRATVNSSTLR